MEKAKNKKRICVFTGARSEYGLLKPLMEEINRDPELELVIVASGMHLSTEFGLTYRHIESDGFTIHEKVEILLSADSATGTASSMGLGLMGFAKAFERLKPEVLVILGDRYETFAAVTSAVLLNIPVAHIHGGELTYGAWDDAFRHAITKMSSLHFTCTDEYKKRVIQMGEAPDRVFNVGALGVENIVRSELIPEKDLYLKLGFDKDNPFLLVTFHPVTREKENNETYFASLIEALSDDQFENYKYVFTKSNSDSSGRKINSMIDRFVEEKPHNSVCFETMGQTNYLTAMKYASAMIGNSSSGIIEAPCFELPVINIGSRQQGRVRAANVIDCGPEPDQVKRALVKGLSQGFRAKLNGMTNPFYKEATALNITEIIKKFNFNNQVMKEFFNIQHDF